MAKSMYLEEKIDRILAILEGSTAGLAVPPMEHESAHLQAGGAEEEDEPPVPPKRRGKGKAKAATPEHDEDDIRELATKVSDAKGGMKKVVALLHRFGCKKLSELEAERYDEFYTQLEAVQNGDEDPF